MVVGAVAHNLFSLHKYLNSSFPILSNFTQLSSVTMFHSHVSGSSFQTSPNMLCQCHGAKYGLETELWSFQASRSWKPCRMAGGREGCRFLGESTSATWPLFCHKKYQPGMMLPRIGNVRGTSNFRAARGSKGPSNITIYLTHGNEYGKGKWEDDGTEGFSNT